MTLADLKREAKIGTLEAKMTVRCGATNIPEQLQGWRKIVDSNSVAIFIMRPDGRKSELRLEKSSLVDYDGEALIVYNSGCRSLNAMESQVMNGWKEKSNTQEFKRREEIDALTDGSSTYWSKVAYFRNAGMEYLMGCKKERGLKYDFVTRTIQDDRIKGVVSMRYEIRKVVD